ncbi:DUF4349 domain-containing protein [Streptomyces sp. CB01881]|nr:DUF4349 domain-containing protein [Streptomyces sp. CB01881]TYC72860.1 DUF4349 domain-containing protein [Streptomyces sp. CB01881]
MGGSGRPSSPSNGPDARIGAPDKGLGEGSTVVRGRRGAGYGAGVAAAVLAAAVLAGGCGAGSGRGEDSAAAVAKQDAAAPAAGAPAVGGAAPAPPSAAAKPGAPATGGAGQPGTVTVADTRLIAYTAQLSVRTKDVAAALAKARELAASAGGYVSGETVSGGGGDAAGQSGQITVKVPSAAFQQTLDQLSALGEVLSRRSQADDVTQQVADVSSRVQTQQASVDRVRALMAQAKTLGEITSLEGELSRREADLESLQKQLKELSARTSLSTVTLDVRREAGPVRPGAPDKGKDEGFWASVGSALGGGWGVLVAIVRAVAVAVAAATPFLLVLGPAALAFWLVRRRRSPGPAPVVPPLPAHLPHRPEPEEEREPQED